MKLAALFFVLLFGAVSCEDYDVQESMTDCVNVCELTCGVMGLPFAGVEKLPSCQAKCDECVKRCSDDVIEHEDDEIGVSAYFCGHRCVPIDDKMIHMTREEEGNQLKATCEASSVPEHRTRYEELTGEQVMDKSGELSHTME